MALLKCPDCGSDVSSEAAACPKCGRKARSKVSPLRIVGMLAIVALLIWAYIVIRDYERKVNGALPPERGLRAVVVAAR